MEAVETLYDEEMFSKEDWLLIVKEKESIDILFEFLNHGKDEEPIKIDDVEAQQNIDVFDA